jgi:D-beta-D-heptose 7-phosphate kinase/D-beta-D-heptose 1-phosphate adenosyltransferase
MKELKSIQQQKKYKILLIGDSCVDEYVYGSVLKLSPEAPVPVLNFESKEFKPGMAANVKSNLQALGCDVDFITNHEQIKKIRYIDKKTGQHLLRVDEEPPVDEWNSRLPTSLLEYDSVIISDYGKGFVSYDHIVFIKKNFPGPIFLDTKKTNLSKFNEIFVKINELEFNRSTGVNDHLIVTLGKKGAVYKNQEQEIFFNSPDVEVFDVCGAGDTFLSALAYMYLETSDLDASIRFANNAAAITVQHLGVYAPTLEEIL